MSAAHLNVVLLEISNQLNNENLESLKFLVRSQIGKQKLERIKTGLQLFEVLIERGHLASDQTDYLANLLRQIHREDLSNKLNSLEIQSGNSNNDISDAEKAKLDIAIEVIKESLGKNWRKLGRKLRVTEVKLDSISTRHPTDLEEMAVELLKEWRKSRAAEARTEELIAALRNCQLNLTADKIQEQLECEGFTRLDQ
ncbi:protein FADD [Girardinichthys multiradiatus]|uniref:protein FADD n=1 Tax=Girardinichthys multiradiatus TaxID=208333 RepID=UPI001FAD71A4|nr:protein FADD [Girardinichthys multiradiatus]